jgi:hypothetical protein
MFWCRLQWVFNRLLNDPDPQLAALMAAQAANSDTDQAGALPT